MERNAILFICVGKAEVSEWHTIHLGFVQTGKGERTMPDREKVIKAVEDAFDLIHSDFIGTDDFNEIEWEQNKADAIALLKEQEAKTGYWIDSAGNDKCSICGAEYSDLYPDYGNTHFCPSCGAKMKGQQEIVLCKDCKRHLECDYWIENGDYWFCADGERAEAEVNDGN